MQTSDLTKAINVLETKQTRYETIIEEKRAEIARLEGVVEKYTGRLENVLVIWNE